MHLRTTCPRQLRVLIAPFAVRGDRFNEVQPDVLVAGYDDLTEERLPAPPVLAVEVISPTSRLRDANLKKAVYARMGVESYWLVDPRRQAPAITAFGLSGDDYEQVAHVQDAEAYEPTVPFRARVVPRDLVAGLRP